MATIPLTKGLVAIVDDSDVDLLSAYKWRAHNGRHSYYAGTSEGLHGVLLMHRLLAGAKAHEKVNHLNRDSLDNRRNNLRIATLAMNNHNRIKGLSNQTGFRGVSKDGQYDRWRAYIRRNRKTIYLGYFLSPQEAAKAYDVAALEIYSEHAVTNF